MKRSRVVLVVFAAVLGLAACGTDQAQTSNQDSSAATPSPSDAGAAADQESPLAEDQPAIDGSEFEVADAEPGDFIMVADGAKVRFDVTVDPTDPAVVPFEKYRTATGGDEVTYLSVTIDNVDGTGDFEFTQVNFVANQTEGEAVPVWQSIGDWQETVDITAEGDLYNTGVDLYNANLEKDSALPGAKTTAIYTTAGTGVVPERLFAVGPSGEQFEAIKMVEPPS